MREAFGVEADFAIDASGRIYMADIEVAASFQVTVWEADGTFVRHAKWPAVPVVDRDWIRAEGDGVLYFVYNAVTVGSNVYRSLNGGTTWSPQPVHTVDYGLANVAIWPEHELCLFGGTAGEGRSVDCSDDRGETWGTDSAPFGPGGFDAFPVGAYDEAGNLYLAETRLHDDGSEIIYVVRDADGRWRDVRVISPPGTHRMPWLAAGAEGNVAVEWYGTDDTHPDGDSQWSLWTAASRDGLEWEVAVADPEPVFTGVLGRELLDFLQAEIGPDGAVHVAYSKLRGDGPDGNKEALQYVRTDPTDLAMQDYFWG